MTVFRSSSVSFLAGLLFAAGLGVSEMSRPGKVLAFLDVAGAWDPSLLLVMVGAIGVHLGFALRARRADRAVAGCAVAPGNSLDATLLAGAALFGVGWGMQGYCPGPAVVASASGSVTPLVFLVSMIAGLLVPRLLLARDGAPGASVSFMDKHPS
jgi:uncharacterized membrane protein YedE/YeeE